MKYFWKFFALFVFAEKPWMTKGNQKAWSTKQEKKKPYKDFLKKTNNLGRGYRQNI